MANGHQSTADRAICRITEGTKKHKSFRRHKILVSRGTLPVPMYATVLWGLIKAAPVDVIAMAQQTQALQKI